MLRRHLWRWLTVAMLASLAAAAAAPTTASATVCYGATTCGPDGQFQCQAGTEPRYLGTAGTQCVRVSPAPLGHQGWAWYEAPMCIALAGVDCTPVAWSWTRRGWQRGIAPNTGWVYLYPYTGTWRWAWTRNTGWVAMSGARFELFAQ